MKNFFLLVIAAVALAGLNASAQVAPIYYQNTTAQNNTTTFINTTNLATPILMDVRKQNNVVLFASLRGTTTPTNSYTFGWSEDGSTIVTNAADVPSKWIVDAPSGITGNRTTNLATLGHGYLVVVAIDASMQNTNSLKYNTKIQAP